MLQYEELIPALPLQEYIECYWILKSEIPLVEELCLPDGSVSFIFNFGSPYYRASCHSPKEWTEVKKISMPHQGKESILINQNEPIELIGVRFKPYGMASFYGVSMVDYSPPFLLHEPQIENWVHGFHALWETTNISERIIMIEKVLLNQLKDAVPVDELVLNAVTEIVKKSGNLRISDLLDHLCVSKSNLEKKFQEHIGLSPKILCNILRFNSIIYDQQQYPTPSLTELTYKQGFFDQSHLVHNFRSFTGLPPGKFFKQNYKLVEMLRQSFASRTSGIYESSDT